LKEIIAENENVQVFKVYCKGDEYFASRIAITKPEE